MPHARALVRSDGVLFWGCIRLDHVSEVQNEVGFGQYHFAREKICILIFAYTYISYILYII